jgi:hypothetical protein
MVLSSIDYDWGKIYRALQYLPKTYFCRHTIAFYVQRTAVHSVDFV